MSHQISATRQLPPGYAPPRVLNLARPITILLMTLGSVFLLVPFAWLSLNAIRLLRRGASTSLAVDSGGDLVALLLVLVGVIVVPIVLHEAIHGAFFFHFTRDRPVFAFKGYAASAGAPEWHLPRQQYLVVGLAPLGVLTILGLGLIAVVPDAWLEPLALAITFHGAGTIGDLVSVFWLLRFPRGTLFRDTGDVLNAYPPLADPTEP